LGNVQTRVQTRNAQQTHAVISSLAEQDAEARLAFHSTLSVADVTLWSVTCLGSDEAIRTAARTGVLH
jgi:hypothetical protein